MCQRHPSLALFAFLLVSAIRIVAADSPAETRAAFLKLIERPRVPLAVEITPTPFALPPGAQPAFLEYGFSYASEAGQRVPALLIKPAARPSERRPVVIVLHGTGGNKEGQLPLLRELAAMGFLAVAFDAPYHGARTTKAKGLDYTDAILRAYRSEEPHDHPFYYDTVRDLMRLVDYLVTREDVDPARIGGIGLSKGGTELYLAAAVDPRLAAVVPCIGVQSFRWALENDSWHSRIGTIQEAFDAAAKDAGVAPDAAFLKRFYARTNPGIVDRFDGPAMVPLIAPRALLVVNGDSDPRTPQPGLKLCIDAIRAAYRTAGADDKFTFLLQPHTAHKVNPETMVTAREWLARQLRP
jgi:dienelactone hydrolase